ncbi:acyl-CoA dehydrogenase family protein [Williamsia sp. SKLECPSW1]
MADTHSVFNQVPPFVGHNAADHPALGEALVREGGEWGLGEVQALGALAGTEEAMRWGELADRNRPVLHTHDKFGHRIDEVEYDPAYHRLMATATEHGLHSGPWTDHRPGAHAVRSAKLAVWNVEAGHLCPISMTYAVVPALRHAPDLAEIYEPLLTVRDYDPVLAVPTSKRALTAGMSMTEKQGGSDVRANQTSATPTGDGTYTIVGHKWFTSAPMSDFFLTLAQAPGGLSCFFVPRVLPDGTRNRLRLQRLKDKLGNHGNASSEIEYDDATGWLMGEEGRGVRTIIEMVSLTRLDCAVASASVMMTGLSRAMHHAQHRSAFGDYLIDQPLMRNVLADLAIEAEAAIAVSMRMAGATDAAERGDEREGLIRRIGLPATKYWTCKRAPVFAAEAMECLGGNGYIEDFGMARLFRESPLAGIWEGSGNVSALDMLRAMATAPKSVEAITDELDSALGLDERYDAHVASIKSQLGDLEHVVIGARRLAESLCVGLQGALLLRHGHPAVAEAFAATRLARNWGSAFGTLPPGLDLSPILERALVK